MRDFATRQELASVLVSGSVDSVSLSPDGTRLASAKYGKVYVQDVVTGKELIKLDAPHSVDDLVWFSPDGTYLAFASSHGIRIWKRRK